MKKREATRKDFDLFRVASRFFMFIFSPFRLISIFEDLRSKPEKLKESDYRA